MAIDQSSAIRKPAVTDKGPLVAVLDIGKTNLKLLLATADGEPVDQTGTVNRFSGATPYPWIDTDGIERWFLEALRAFAPRYRIGALIVSSHACTGTLCDENGAVLPMMDYEAPFPERLEGAYAAVAPGYEELMTSIGPGAMRIARQLFWQQRDFPEAFARAKYFLGLPNYIAWRLGGRRASEISHMMAQSHLWAPLARDFSSVVKSQGWQRLFPPFVVAGESLGSVSAHVATATGLAPDTQVLCGVHDSNANLFRYKAAGMDNCTLFSTGTWMIGFDRQRPVAIMDSARGMVANADVDGQPVASTLSMAGREYALMVGDAPDVPDAEVLAAARALVARGTMALASFVPDDGQFPGSAGKGRMVGLPPQDAAEKRALGALYVAFNASLCLDLLQSAGKPVIIDGGFAANRPFAQVLAALRPGQKVSISHARDGTALGAALLWQRAARTGPVGSVRVEGVTAADVPGVEAMARAWAADQAPGGLSGR